MGFFQGEKPKPRKVGIRPQSVSHRALALAPFVVAAKQERSQAASDKLIDSDQPTAGCVFEVPKPASQHGIQLPDDLLQTPATVAAGLFPYLVLQRLFALLAHPATPGLEVVAEEVEPLAPFPAVADVGLVRVERQPVGLGPVPYRTA